MELVDMYIPWNGVGMESGDPFRNSGGHSTISGRSLQPAQFRRSHILPEHEIRPERLWPEETMRNVFN